VGGACGQGGVTALWSADCTVTGLDTVSVFILITALGRIRRESSVWVRCFYCTYYTVSQCSHCTYSSVSQCPHCTYSSVFQCLHCTYYTVSQCPHCILYAVGLPRCMPPGGIWSAWSTWTSCGVSCGSNGFRRRYRSCETDTGCAGKAEMTESCRGVPCDGEDQGYVIPNCPVI